MLGQAAMCNPRSLVNYSPDIHEIYYTALLHLKLNIANEWYFEQELCFDYKNNILIQPSKNDLNAIMEKIQDNTLDNLHTKKRYSLIEFRKHLFWYVSGIP
jgi:hypothetical protein